MDAEFEAGTEHEGTRDIHGGVYPTPSGGTQLAATVPELRSFEAEAMIGNTGRPKVSKNIYIIVAFGSSRCLVLRIREVFEMVRHIQATSLKAYFGYHVDVNLVLYHVFRITPILACLVGLLGFQRGSSIDTEFTGSSMF